MKELIDEISDCVLTLVSGAAVIEIVTKMLAAGGGIYLLVKAFESSICG